MKYVLVIAAFVCSSLLISCNDSGGGNTAKTTNSTGTAPTTAPTNHEADVKKMIDELAAALSKNDTAALDKLYSDDYTLVTQTGVVATKKERLEAIKSGDLKFESVAFSETKVRSYGDTAVAIANTKGKSTSKNVNDGKPVETNFRVTFVAHKTKDGWRFVSAHLSPLPEEKKADDASKKEGANKPAETNKATETNKSANK